MSPTEPEISEQETPSFERALARLESIVSKLEQGDTGLDDAIRAYEEGVTLAQLCRERLEAAELRIQRLAVQEEDGDRRDPARLPESDGPPSAAASHDSTAESNPPSETNRGKADNGSAGDLFGS